MKTLPVEDLESIYERVKVFKDQFKNARIFITGASGFVGSWVVDSLLYWDNKGHLDLELYCLTRNRKEYFKKYPYLNGCVTVIESDIRDLKLCRDMDYIIHLASHDGHRLNIQDKVGMYDVIANGTLSILNSAFNSNAKKTLVMSSGVVNRDEDNPYASGKRISEYLCLLFNEQYKMDIKIARGYNFIGPRMPLDKHFAIGNFIGDVLNNRAVIVNSDGLAKRSYLYMSDVVTWLFVVLINGKFCNPYKIGSYDPYSIKEVAQKVAEHGRYLKCVNILSLSGSNGNTYYPAGYCSRLELKETVKIDEAIGKTIRWYRDG